MPSQENLIYFNKNYKEATHHCLTILEILILSFWAHNFFNGHVVPLCFKILIIGFWVSNKIKKIRLANAEKDPV